jgi:hypothetical protein
MDVPESDPFMCHPDCEHNACVNNWMQFVELADYYVQSADSLVESALSEHMLLDVHVYSICFLYRHGLELILKDLVWKSHYVGTGEKRFAESGWQELGRHRLQDLWNRGVEIAGQVLGTEFPLPPSVASQVENLLTQFERHDPNSYSFRYPIDRKSGRTHPSLTNVNLRVLRNNVHHAFDQLKTLVGFIDYCYDQKSETERPE